MLAGLLSLLAIGFYVGAYRPIIGRLNDLSLQIDAKQRQLDADQAHADELPVVALRVDKLRMRLENFDKKLPRKDDQGQFYRDIDEAGQQAGLRKLSIQPSSQQKGELYVEWPILLHFEGEFPAVATFPATGRADAAPDAGPQPEDRDRRRQARHRSGGYADQHLLHEGGERMHATGTTNTMPQGNSGMIDRAMTAVKADPKKVVVLAVCCWR